MVRNAVVFGMVHVDRDALTQQRYKVHIKEPQCEISLPEGTAAIGDSPFPGLFLCTVATFVSTPLFLLLQGSN